MKSLESGAKPGVLGFKSKVSILSNWVDDGFATDDTWLWTTSPSLGASICKNLKIGNNNRIDGEVGEG